MIFYTSNTWVAGPVSQEFEKKYPFVKANVWRSDSKALLKRLTEEARREPQHRRCRRDQSRVHGAHEVREKMLQEHFSPELSAYDDDAKIKGKNGVLWLDQPRDLHQPRLQHQSDRAGGRAEKHEGSPRPEMERKDVDRWDDDWNAMDRRRLETDRAGISRKAQRPRISTCRIFPARRLSGLVASGEVPLSPTIFNSNICRHKQKGAPVDWRPIDPVIAGVGTSGMVLNAPHSPCRDCYFSTSSIRRKGNRRP